VPVETLRAPRRVRSARSGYICCMSENTNERPEGEDVGLVADEDLPADLQPTDDNPLAQDPADSDDGDSSGNGGEQKVEGMPDMGNPTPG
jgi:hypothetical protein